MATGTLAFVLFDDAVVTGVVEDDAAAAEEEEEGVEREGTDVAGVVGEVSSAGGGLPLISDMRRS
eukprot:CAMPEP_0184357192 /NCGR_PEP_ID=MMETSP1089-20130417/107431_1 /TAXON_ID=38269 ORGANISM="Gloeochaete wittrockiana, Strain SAG46.84" /NCGR_SAMPLE_ID=MMETSP1089 /ASSEMBLY_ACC=CAM_ASM_000445 /LENGTH=64 /DNA_ID=CAMNT_0026694819 /DNA_START=719 /DNA_END=913 /DNA_ORIENTATION=+